MTLLLFIGRMHITTKAQQASLTSFSGVSPRKFSVNISQPIDEVIAVITSADHKETKRNPIPIERRIEGIANFLKDVGMKYRIFHIPDIHDDKKWVEFVENQVSYQSHGKIQLTNKNTVLFTLTPSVIRLFKKKGYKIMKRSENKNEIMPFEIISMIAESGKNWKKPDARWKKYASKASIELYKKYNLGDMINDIYSEILTTSEGELAEARNFRTYGNQMDLSMPMKINEISRFIKKGTIADVGCGTGNLLFYLSQNFPESEVIGVDLSMEFLRHCEGQYYPNHNVYFYRKNASAMIFRPGTITTKIFSSILHEVYSYNGYSMKEARQALKNSYEELISGGRIIIRDGVKPENKIVYMKLNSRDGAIKSNDMKKLSTEGKFLKFAREFKKRQGVKYEIKTVDGEKYYKVYISDAYEFMNKKDYAENWNIEINEVYGILTFRQYCKMLKNIGFKIASDSREILNPWIEKNRFSGKVSLFEMRNNKLLPIRYPNTHMVLVGEK